MSPEAATIRILRDARNHGQAVQDSLAETPFLLSRSDTRFLGILTDVRFAARGQKIDGSPAVGGLGVAMTAVGATSVANTITQAVQDANNLLNILGVALEAMLAGHGTLKAMGYVEGSFDGPQWPYLYTAGSKANRGRKRQLIDNLSAGR
jgi:hypothetical protein